MEEHVGYKVCQWDVIVKLKIIGDNNNEGREDVFDHKTAKMRCERVKVIDIYKRKDGKIRRYGIAVSLRDETFKYKLGETIEVEDYNTDINEVCAPGIHYFLTEEAALCFASEPDNGEVIRYHNNGRMSCRYYNIDGEKHGKYTSWYPNGTKNIECIYVNGKRNNKLKRWYDNGNLYVLCNLKDDTLNGKYKMWHVNGKMFLDKNYLDGKLHGECLFYHDNGKLREITSFYKDIRRGKSYVYNVYGELKYEYEHIDDNNYTKREFSCGVVVSEDHCIDGTLRGNKKSIIEWVRGSLH